MDEIDRTIINLLQKNARASLKDLSKHCYISSTAVASRIKKLEQAGIIKGYQAVINLEKINLRIRAFIRVQLEPKQKPEFYRYMRSMPNVVECNCVTGDYSELMEVVFPTTKTLDDFINHIQAEFGKTSTQVVFSTSVDHRGVTLSKPKN